MDDKHAEAANAAALAEINAQWGHVKFSEAPAEAFEEFGGLAAFPAMAAEDHWRQIRPTLAFTPSNLFNWLAAQGYTKPAADRLPLPTVFELLRRAAEADSKTDNRKKSSPPVPENPDVAKLAKKIKRDLPKGGTKIDIARDFTKGDKTKAESLLRQVRKFKLLAD